VQCTSPVPPGFGIKPTSESSGYCENHRPSFLTNGASMHLRNMLFVLLIFVNAAWTAHSQTGVKAKVGDWVSYKQTNTFFNKEVAIKQTVKAIDDKKVTLRIESTLEGKTMPGKDTQIPLEQFTDPLKSFAKEKGKLEKIDSGKETIEVGNKKVECEWTS